MRAFGRHFRHWPAAFLAFSPHFPYNLAFSRLAGYDDTNDADRLAYDPAMRVVVGWQGSERKAASTSEMGRFETETLTEEKNLRTVVGP